MATIVFYTSSPQECADILANYGSAWVLETAAAFYVAMPDAATGACPANTRPVYRFASTANPTRRRYTAEVDVRDSMIRRGGWTQEGFGLAPDQVAMCAPTAGPTTIGPPAGGNATTKGFGGPPPDPNRVGGCRSPQQGDTLFVGWFTYDSSGKPWWLSMTANKTAPDSYSGLLIETSGPPFNAVPFNPNEVIRTPIGAATLTFSDGGTGTFSYAMAGAAQTKAITRFVVRSLAHVRLWDPTRLRGGGELPGCLVRAREAQSRAGASC